MKLNRLKDKNARYQSHREFLSQCIESKLIPKGLKLELEPTIGNHDQEFLDMWYSNLQEFSLTLMKGIVKFCDKTSETAAYITSTEKALKQNMEKEEFQKIKETISRNEEATKRVQKQIKFKKFNYLKHKPDTERNKKTSQTTTLQDTLKPTYASILKNNTNIASNGIKQNTNPTGERPTLQQNLQSFTSKHSRSRSESLKWKASKTNQQNQSDEIASLKAELKNLNNKNKTVTTQKLKLTRNLTVLQKIPKQRNIQKTYKRPPKEANWKSRITECYNMHRRNHENFGNLRKTIEKSIRHQSEIEI